jgi:hypothetical protein
VGLQDQQSVGADVHDLRRNVEGQRFARLQVGLGARLLVELTVDLGIAFGLRRRLDLKQPFETAL